MNCHRNVIQFNKIQKKTIQINVIFWNIYIIVYIIESTLRIKFQIFHLEKY
jgi:hypothetical protein